MPSFLKVEEPRRGRLKRCWMSGGNVYGMSAEQLAAYVENGYIITQNEHSSEKEQFLLLDCRSFLAHNQSHISGAINVHCPAILRRRSGGRLPLQMIIPISEVREKLAGGSCQAVILYEEHCRKLMEDSISNFVVRCLQQESSLRSIYILEGGFHHFKHQQPHLCTSSVPFVNLGSARNACTITSPKLKFRCTLGVEAEDQDEPVEILPHLYLGSAHHASCKGTLQSLGITALLNVSHTCPNYFEDSFVYKSIPVEDTGSEDIGAWFQEAIEYLDQVKSSNGKALVHCHAGISRSATICIAYLMSTKRLRMEDAYEYVKSRRKVVSPNFSFMGQLLTFESQVFATGPVKCSSPSPRSPLLAVVASTPDPDSLTPSRGAKQSIFDFAMPSASSSANSCPLISPLGLTNA